MTARERIHASAVAALLIQTGYPIGVRRLGLAHMVSAKNDLT
jgi:hypothetical protein